MSRRTHRPASCRRAHQTSSRFGRACSELRPRGLLLPLVYSHLAYWSYSISSFINAKHHTRRSNFALNCFENISSATENRFVASPSMKYLPSTDANARDAIRPMTKLHIFISVAGRYARCRISSSVRGLMSKGPAPPQGGGAVGDPAAGSSPISGPLRSPPPLHFNSPTP